MPKLTQEEACKVFIKSMDDEKHYTSTAIIPESSVNVIAKITTKLWDDGAPHTKYFDRDEISAEFTFESGVTYHIVTYGGWGPWERIYWFNNNIWYRLTLADDGWEELIGRDEEHEGDGY